MNTKTKSYQTSVVIVGGGITGLSACLFLKQQGIDFILLEKHKGTSIHPRARTIDIRTMELFRELGLSEALREGGKELAPAWGVIRGKNLMNALETTDSKIIGKITFPSQLAEMQEMAKQSPETGCRCTQDISEQIIYKNLIQQHSDLRFYHQMISFEQNEDTVEVWAEDRETGDQYKINASYMIATDGANSSVRKQLNIPVTGSGSLTDLLNIYFEADLTQFVKGREFSQLLIETPEITGFLLAINNKDRWAFHLRYYPEKGETSQDFTPERVLPILNKILGLDHINIKILNILPWQLTVRIADYLRYRNIFIAGDAAHTMTPYAGKGANCGIQDVQNLVWKLALVLQDKAGDALLETYNTERQSVGAFYANLSGELADENGLIKEELLLEKGHTLLGLPDYRYISPAIISKPNDSTEFFKGVPGTRMPHIWTDEEHLFSTLDLVKGNFGLLPLGNIAYWKMACQEVEKALGIAIYLHQFTSVQVSEHWSAITNLQANEALLIRPDEFVAARIADNGSKNNLMTTLQQILSRA